VPLIYDELRVLAARRLGQGGDGYTLQPTALVHEAYAKLVDSDAKLKFTDRAHFFALAARTMRSVLVDHIRARNSGKRGGGRAPVTLTANVAADTPPTLDLLALDEALNRLAEFDARKASVIEIRFFGGLTHAEAATALGISEATVERDLRLAKAWLAEQLDESS
jgi:RNA polymerase sigma factor (TIGR02999 family)